MADQFSWYDPGSLGGLYDTSNSESNVLQNTINAGFKPYENQTLSNLKRRGFSSNSDLYSPTIEAGLWSDVANKKSTALTDLWFKNEANKMNWNADKRAGKLAEVQYGTMEDARALSGKQQASGAGTVLCTELFRQGLLPIKYLKADLRFLAKHVTKREHVLYLQWAGPIVEIMRKSKLITMLIYLPVLCWNIFMYRIVHHKQLGILGNIGKIVHNIGIKYGEYRDIKKITKGVTV